MRKFNSIEFVRNKRWIEKYSVTVNNDNRLTDFQGFVHTWLVIRRGNEATTFSFSNGSPCGVSSASEMSNRIPTDKLDIEITKNQYDNMMAEISSFYASCPKYSLLPKPACYNCVTAAGRILSAGNVDLLNRCHTPQDVQNEIRQDFNLQFSNYWATALSHTQWTCRKVKFFGRFI